MRYVIDAFNLVHKDDGLYELLDARGFPPLKEKLLRMLAEFAEREKGAGIVAVFDGSPKAGGGLRRERGSGFVGASRIEMVFADPDHKADRTILDLIDATKRPGEITVVSDDKFVSGSAKSAGARTMSCREFLTRMRAAERRANAVGEGEDPRKFRGLTEREVGEWMDYFGFKDDE
ncbi:MAG: NYN domain-containing protein [Planctomycetota bacterium]|nr:NYN domain-containing protein [Planctomycetota bacterium]